MNIWIFQIWGGGAHGYQALTWFFSVPSTKDLSSWLPTFELRLFINKNQRGGQFTNCFIISFYSYWKTILFVNLILFFFFQNKFPPVFYWLLHICNWGFSFRLFISVEGNLDFIIFVLFYYYNFFLYTAA